MCLLADEVRRHAAKLAWAFYALWTVVFTWPLAARLTSSLYGDVSDNLGSVWILWWIRRALERGVPWQDVTLLAVPFGWDLGSVPLQYPTIFLAAALSRLVGEVAVYNLIILLGFWLSAVTMYLLVYHLTRSRPSAFVAGLVYGFAPYHSAHARAHLHLAAMQWLPLCLLALLKLDEKRSLKSGVVWALAFAVVLLDSYYYGYFMALITAVFFLVRLLRGLAHRRWPFDRRYLMALLTGSVVLALLVAPAAYPILQRVREADAGAEEQALGYARTLDQVYKLSAAAWNYFLPSTDHPFFGRYAESLARTQPSYNPREHTLYLGCAGLGLTMVAFLRQRALDRRQRFFLVLFTTMAVAAFVLSAPPTLSFGGRDLSMPSRFLYRLFPMFRVYARFGAIMLLGVAALAGMGLMAILARLRVRWQRTALVVVVSGIVLIEFAQGLPAPAVDLRVTPDVYAWLVEQPGDFVLAEYPLAPSNSPEYYTYLYHQTRHGKRLLNGTIKGTRQDYLRLALTDLSDPDAPAILAHLGVRYAIVHEDAYAGEGLQLPSSSGTPGLALIGRFVDTRVYGVLSTPLPDVVTWLADQEGDFGIAEYPMEPGAGPDYFQYLFYEGLHGKQSFNRILREDWPAQVHHGLADLSSPDVPAMLAYLGVHYVVVHEDEYAGLKCSLPGTESLVLVAAYPEARIYALPPASAGVMALFRSRGCGWPDGFYPVETGEGGRGWRWMDVSAHLALFNPAEKEARIDVRGMARSIEGDKTLQLFVDDVFVGQFPIPGGVEVPVELRYLVIPPGLTDVAMVVPEGGSPLGLVLQNDDPRVASVALGDLGLSPNPWTYTLPDATHRPRVDFGGLMALVGYDLAEEGKPLRAGSTLPVRLYWQALAEMERDYTVSLQVLGEGRAIAQLDRQPFSGLYPTSRWRVGEIVIDDLVVAVPSDVPSGNYPLILLVYDLATMERLPVESGDAEPEWLELSRVRVASP